MYQQVADCFGDFHPLHLHLGGFLSVNTLVRLLYALKTFMYTVQYCILLCILYVYIYSPFDPCFDRLKTLLWVVGDPE